MNRHQADTESASRVAIAGEVVHQAVAQLATERDMILRLQAKRWPLAAEALLDGEMPEVVAEAAGIEVSELRVALMNWATKQRRNGAIDQARYEQLTIHCVLGPATW